MQVKTRQSNILLDELLSQQYMKRHVATLRKHHKDSLDHSVRVGLLAADIGYENDLDPADIKVLCTAGILHDLGKVEIPSAILNKKGPLTMDERTVMDKHTVHGHGKIKERFLDKVRAIVIHHHDYASRDNDHPGHNCEHPNHHKGSIPYLTEIIAAADMFDALMHARSYKKGFSKKKIERIMRREFTGNHELIDQLLRRY